MNTLRRWGKALASFWKRTLHSSPAPSPASSPASSPTFSLASSTRRFSKKESSEETREIVAVEQRPMRQKSAQHQRDEP